MDGAAGGVFAMHDLAWMPGNNLDSIVEERSSRLEDDLPQDIPSPKRLRAGFECERCGKNFTEKRSLVRHNKHAANCKRGEQSLKPFACTICSKGFTRDDVRQRHENEKHYNVKRRQRGLGLISNLRLGPTSRSGPRGIAPALPSPVSTSGDARSDPLDSPTSHRTAVNSPWTNSLASMSVLSPSNSNFNIIDSRNGSDSSPSNSSSAQRRRWSNSMESDASTGSSLKVTSPSTSFTTYGSDLDQTSMVADTCGSEPQVQQDDYHLSRRISFELPSRQNFVKGGASRRPGSYAKTMVCPLCNKSFGTTKQEVQAHFDRHELTTEGQHECGACQIRFVHRADLNHHLLSAEGGFCGLSFDHAQECTGHHPPIRIGSGLSDHDRIELIYCVQNWEQSQLRDFITVVSEVVDHVSSAPGPDDAWSIDGALRKSMQSLSLRFSGMDIRSTPEYMEQHVRKAYARVRRSVSNRVPEASLKIRLERKSANDVRLGIALVEAAAEGNVMKMAQLIHQGAPVNDPHILRAESAACTPLTAAVCTRNKDAVEFLLKNKAAVDGISSHDSVTVATPLCLAAGNGDLDIVRCLLAHDVNVNKRAQKDGGNPACYAARNGHTQVLSELIDHGADIDLHASVDLLEGDEVDQFVPLGSANVLAIAVYHDRYDTAKMLVEQPGVDSDYCDISSALAMASYQGNMAMIELLLGKHPWLCTFYAMWIAASQGHKFAVDALIDHQRRLKQPLPLQSPKTLRHAIRRSQRDMASLMLSVHESSAGTCDLDVFACRNFESRSTYALFQQANLSTQSKEELDHGMALNCAIYYNDMTSAGILIEAGITADADVYVTNLRNLATNLSLACRLGHPNIVRLLLQCGANPAPDGHLSLDLLEAALESESVDTLRILFAAKAALSTRKDGWSCSPFNASVQKICKNGLNDILRLLIDAGVDVNQLHVEDGSNEKTTLLHIVAMCEPTEATYETTKLLLEAGADPRSRVDSRTASDLIHTHWMGMNGRTPAFTIAKRTAELLNLWERRRDIMARQSWV